MEPMAPGPVPLIEPVDTRTGLAWASPPAADMAPHGAGPAHGLSARELLERTARFAAYAAGGYLALVLALLVIYRFVDPPASTLMLFQALTGREVRQDWVPLEAMSPQLVRAVLVAEDGRFCQHWGIDLAAIEEAIDKAGDGAPRGASTISMQVTKNLFLWQSKSYLRKLIELPLTVVMELLWPKWRILEVYLNVAELGPGVFGAEAASQFHFNKPASRLSEREAALLAASLPNPIIRDAGDPGPRTARKAAVIQSRMRAAGAEVAGCVLGP
jgi:monofunctional biosynthetic peptidoglycan transglycosylase